VGTLVAIALITMLALTVSASLTPASAGFTDTIIVGVRAETPRKVASCGLWGTCGERASGAVATRGALSRTGQRTLTFDKIFI
jgi:hypothetical protein